MSETQPENTQPENTQPGNPPAGDTPVSLTFAQLEELIGKRVEAESAKIRADGARTVQRLRDMFTPQHAAGPGTTVAETWSQAQQEQAKTEADNA